MSEPARSRHGQWQDNIILWGLSRLRGATARQLAEYTGVPELARSRRFQALAERGVLRRGRFTHDGVSAVVWEVAPRYRTKARLTDYFTYDRAHSLVVQQERAQLLHVGRPRV